VNHSKLTLGRVQTPTLGLIVKRDELIDNFSEMFYYDIILKTNDKRLELRVSLDKDDPRLPDGKLLNEREARQICDDIRGEAISIDVSSKEKKKLPPRLLI
jgi:DNA topoisomerase-3